MRVERGVALKAFDEDNGWNEGRPQIPRTQFEDQRSDLSRADSESRDATRIKKQHALSTGLARGPPFEPSRNGGGAFALLR